MQRNLHYIDHNPAAFAAVPLRADPEPSPSPSPSPAPAPAPAPAPGKNKRKILLYILLVAAILGLIYGLYCLLKQMKGKQQKYAASTRYYYF